MIPPPDDPPLRFPTPERRPNIQHFAGMTMFGLKRRRRFEEAVKAEIAYMLAIHGEPAAAARAARERAARSGIGASRTAVISEAAERLARQSSAGDQGAPE